MFQKYLQRIGQQSVKGVRNFVIGNSSVDYDSFFGSILMAYLLTTTTSRLHLPIIDCSLEELAHRFEIQHVLQLLKIDPGVLKFRSCLGEIEGQSSFSLFDHNLRKGLDRVEYIVDHHDAANPAGRKILISKMGSCLTHLYYLFYPSKLGLVKPTNQEESNYVHAFREFVKGEPFEAGLFEERPEPQIEEIIRYGILIDTFNFDKNQKERWTIFDQKALEMIEQSKIFELHYHHLEDLKFNQALNKNLSLQAALQKDYKSYDYGALTIEYSNVFLSPHDFLNHYRESLAQRFGAQMEADIYLVMSLCKQNGVIRRSLLFKAREQGAIVKTLCSFLQSLKMKDLGVLEGWHYWEDPSNAISRKAFDKELRSYLAKNSQL